MKARPARYVRFSSERRIVVPSDDHGFTTAEAVLPSNAGPTVRLRNLLTTEECGRVLELARAHCRYNTTPDSVDGRPTYEAPVYDAATGPVNVGLCRALESAMERRAQGRKRVIQRRFNVGVLEAISERKASTL